MVIKLHGKLPLIWVKNPIVFEGHRSKVKVTGVKNSVNLGPISPFPDDNSTVISVMVIKLYGKLPLIWVKNPFVLEVNISKVKVTEINLGSISFFLDHNLTTISVIVIKLYGKLPLMWVENPSYGF